MTKQEIIKKINALKIIYPLAVYKDDIIKRIKELKKELKEQHD